ncbi:MAG TPA: RNA-binding protein [Burkholderiales bacterium]|nr:RNA-binding protein [Burkholderiales bacterium]
MKIWVDNLPPEATVDEVKELLVKYGFPDPTGIQSLPGDGTHPGMSVDFEGVHPEGIRPLIERVDGLFWKGRQIVVTQA